MSTYTTQMGDTWDIIAKRVYGNELHMAKLIAANIDYRKVVVFKAGVKLVVPVVETSVAMEIPGLPVWKQGGSL